MRISISENSDRRALRTGDPGKIRVSFSVDPRAAAAGLVRRGPGERSTVLLLGANGFIGMHILRELLDDDRIERVFALVRGNGKTSGQERLARQVRKFRLALPDDHKLTVLEASYTEPSMGLPADRYAELSRTVDAVVDATGATNHTYSYARYRKEKLRPTLDLVEFCYRDRLKSLHVLGSAGSEVYRTRRDFYRYSFFHCGYSKMKWTLKHLGLHLRKAGAPLFTYQAPFVLGGQHTGFRDPGMQYSFWHMMFYALQTGQIWDSGQRVPVVAADVLARSVVTNMCADHPQDIVYPVTPVTTTEVAERFGLELVSWPEFRRTLTRRFGVRLRDLDRTRPFTSLRHAFRHALFARSLFPRSLPELLHNIDRAVPPTAGPVAGGIRAIDVVVESARNIRKLRRHLPATISTERVGSHEEAA
jgi:nucleoside-diphosphate-sugar epimerase